MSRITEQQIMDVELRIHAHKSTAEDADLLGRFIDQVKADIRGGTDGIFRKDKKE